MSAVPGHVAIIGAGIVGVACSIWLRRAGFEVTLVDRGEPGMGASFGNGGILASCSVVPVTVPGLIAKGPKYLADRDFPLFLRWGYALKLLPWLIRYLSHATDGETRRISRALAVIAGDSLAQHRALAGGTAAERWLRESTYSYVYADRAAFEADSYGWELRREAGFEPEIIEGPAVREAEPILSADAGLMVVNPAHGYILNPAAYVQDLATHFRGMGGRIMRAEVKDFDLSGGRIRAIETDQGRVECNGVVLAAGVWSRPLMKKLGLNVPLEAERGYHIVYRSPSQMPRNPMMLAAGKFVATPMEDGLRCAGIVEFGGLDSRLSKAPLRLLRRHVRRFFPEMRAETQEEWLGFRPAPSDSLPLIGEIRDSGVFTAFGHHHIGLTAGPKTGRMIAELVSGQSGHRDLAAFVPERFTR